LVQVIIHTRYIIIRVLFTFHRPLFLFLFKHFFSIRAPTRRTPLKLKNDNPDSTQRCTRLRCPFFRSHGGSTRTTTPVVAARLALAHSSRRTSPLARFRTPSLQRAKRQRKINESQRTTNKRQTKDNERQRKRSVQSTVPRTSSVHFVPTVRPWSAKVQPIL
jgi:hypothetical protein